MCIAYLALNAHPDWPLFIAANRDELHARPTLTAAPWMSHPDVIAGKDEVAGGTWLGISRTGRFALLTNFRDLRLQGPEQPVSRGELVKNFLTGNQHADTYARAVAQQGHRYQGFNLIVGQAAQAVYVGNQTANPHDVQPLGSGRYVLSNHLLDTDWPKTERLRELLGHFPIEHLERSINRVFELLKDTTPAPDHLLPDTGLDLERERLLSSPFIISPNYGTRCSSVIAVHRNGRAIFSELTYNPQGLETERHDWHWSIQ
ncbi:NRDE family protein [Pusillimonas sp. DMV24BSW_D]|uniref:NRDE family protein n=1 Tax=Neopusillimonas aestuarii TaxID=2716226 RepID=UPI0014085783|nr:NRDE family protein [Pusillimonas sp. DMV24BSW_D]QIM49572.1 NRDE family protein [Pusillimonas sp. DMV24BSW_D]